MNHPRYALWNAIRAYVKDCGGGDSHSSLSIDRVENAIDVFAASIEGNAIVNERGSRARPDYEIVAEIAGRLVAVGKYPDVQPYTPIEAAEEAFDILYEARRQCAEGGGA